MNLGARIRSIEVQRGGWVGRGAYGLQAQPSTIVIEIQTLDPDPDVRAIVTAIEDALGVADKDRLPR